MPLRLILGPPNSGRAGEVLARLRADLGRSPLLVVPTGDDVSEFERELSSSGPVLGAAITTFAGLGGEIVRSLSLALPPPLSPSERQALIRAAIRRAAPRRLARSSARPGFAPALDALIAELQGALLSPEDFANAVAGLDDAGHELELVALYRSYVELREAAGRSDAGALAAAALAGLRTDPGGWRGRPVLVYGFDDLTRVQLELIDALAAACEVSIAVSYEDRRALSVRAGLVTRLRDELGAADVTRLDFDAGHSSSPTLRHLDRSLFEPESGQVTPDGGLVLLAGAGARSEAEAIGIEIARLLADGYAPDEIAVVLRHPDSAGPLLAGVLSAQGVPVALEAELPLAGTCVGGSLLALCRAALDEGAVEELLRHLRADPSLPPGAVDGVERRIRRGEAQSVSEATAHWSRPPRHLERLRANRDPGAALAALALSARELAEGPHRNAAPLASRRGSQAGATPFSALELRAGVAASELLIELAATGSLPGCAQPGVAEAIEALRSASVPHWRGPARGRVRIISPARARVARVRALFCATLADGEFPSAAPPDPLLSEERRREIGNPDLRRVDPAEQERYLFHACVSRPTERLYLSWQQSDEDGAARVRSPFVDEVLDLLAPDAEAAERSLLRPRGPERAVPSPEEATDARSLARALAPGGWRRDRVAALDSLLGGERPSLAAEVESLFAELSDPDELPGPLRAPAVLAELGERAVFSANSLEGWLECPYRWFVNHELAPQRLEPEADPLWLGAVVHRALELVYREAPGEDSIPRPGDVGRWRRRFAELLALEAERRAGAPLNQARRAALDRARVQVEAFLEAESRLETELRPEPRLLELGFGPLDDAVADEEELREPLQLGEISLRGRIDRVDLTPDGRGAVVRDYKTGKTVPRAEDLADGSKLQILLYMRVCERVLGLEPVAGLYHPLGAADPAARKPRGVALAGDERLAGQPTVRTDLRPPEELERLLDDAEARAIAAAAEMRAGTIDRRPFGGSCPKYCNYQSICRLERALGVTDEAGGERTELA